MHLLPPPITVLSCCQKVHLLFISRPIKRVLHCSGRCQGNKALQCHYLVAITPTSYAVTPIPVWYTQGCTGREGNLGAFGSWVWAKMRLLPLVSSSLYPLNLPVPTKPLNWVRVLVWVENLYLDPDPFTTQSETWLAGLPHLLQCLARHDAHGEPSCNDLTGCTNCIWGLPHIRKTPNLLFVTFSCFFMLFSKKAEKLWKSPVLYFLRAFQGW